MAMIGNQGGQQRRRAGRTTKRWREGHGFRVYGAFWTAVAERSGDTAFGRTGRTVKFHPCRACESGVALRWCPSAKTAAVQDTSWFANGPQTARSVLECVQSSGAFLGAHNHASTGKGRFRCHLFSVPDCRCFITPGSYTPPYLAFTSKASRRPSPRKLRASKVVTRPPAGNMISHQ